MRTTVSSRRRTAVPADVRKRFKLAENSRLEWIIEGDLITVLPVPSDPVRSFRGTLRGRYSGFMLLRERRRERRRGRSRS